MIKHSFTTALAAVAVFVLVVVTGRPAAAQDARIQIPNLDHLAKVASEAVDITLDNALLQLAAGFLNDDKDDAAVKQLIQGLKGIYVKSFEFDKDGMISAADIDAIRAQLSHGRWQRLVNVKSLRDASNSEVYVWLDGGVSEGLVVLVTEPREMTFVNIVGRIDLEKLRHLEGQFGIPRLQKDGRSPANPKEE